MILKGTFWDRAPIASPGVFDDLGHMIREWFRCGLITQDEFTRAEASGGLDLLALDDEE